MQIPVKVILKWIIVIVLQLSILIATLLIENWYMRDYTTSSRIIFLTLVITGSLIFTLVSWLGYRLEFNWRKAIKTVLVFSPITFIMGFLLISTAVGFCQNSLNQASLDISKDSFIITYLLKRNEIGFTLNRESRYPIRKHMGRIIGLQFHNKGEISRLTKELSQLDSLQEIKFTNCNISEIERGSPGYFKVRKVNLHDNKITMIPKVIVEMPSLTDLDLSKNSITILPPFIGKYTRLIKLNLSCNKISLLSLSVVRLTRLRSVNFPFNFIKEIPREISSLKFLDTLNSLPEEIGALQNLRVLILSWNQLTSLPKSVGDMQNLVGFYIDHNKITELPSQIGALESLQYLDLSNNDITLIQEQIDKLHSLRILNLDGNRIASLPKSLLKLKNLKSRSLSSKNLDINKMDSSIKVMVDKFSSG